MKIFAGIIVFSLFLSPASINAKDSKELYSDHFIIVSDKTIDQQYLYKVKNMAEYFYKTLTQEFKFIRDEPWLWKNRAKIFVAKDRGEYVKQFGCPEWSNACVDYQGKAIFTYPQQKEFSLMLSHELTHIIFREYLGLQQLPLWLDEGMSVYMEHKYEKKPSNDKFILLKKMISEKKYIKFDDLNKLATPELKGKSKGDVDIFYLESFSIVNFLVGKWSRYKMSNFFKFLKDGYNINEALCKAYNIRTLEELEKQWMKFYQP
ncbi:MAG: peptidase MA family metallohydrolase [Candidatus Omnitrophica bacterium]|nr:peptidase MA family metallohydrolase [Candidatus Omnitrophota bacterium]